MIWGRPAGWGRDGAGAAMLSLCEWGKRDHRIMRGVQLRLRKGLRLRGRVTEGYSYLTPSRPPVSTRQPPTGVGSTQVRGKRLALTANSAAACGINVETQTVQRGPPSRAKAQSCKPRRRLGYRPPALTVEGSHFNLRKKDGLTNIQKRGLRRRWRRVRTSVFSLHVCPAHAVLGARGT